MSSWDDAVKEDREIFEMFKKRFMEEHQREEDHPVRLNQNLIAELPPFGKNGKPSRRFKGEGHDLRIISEPKLVLRYTFFPEGYRKDEELQTLSYQHLKEAALSLHKRIDGSLVDRLFSGRLW